jgi:hypothetical protein
MTDPHKFPVLFDAVTRTDGKIMKTSKGFFDYDTNRFRIPSNKAATVRQHFPADWEIMESVGVDVV